jgi:predicted transcriptional regulator
MTRKDELKLIAQLARSNTYIEVLKPQLELLKKETEMVDPQNEFQAVKMAVQRVERIKIINKILNLIETSEEQLDKIRNK